MTPPPTQSHDLREKISAMLTEAEITSEELYEMLFGRGREAPDMPEYSHGQMMSEGTWQQAGLGQDELEIVAAHVDIRSALASLDAAEAPEVAAELSALLSEEITATEQGELQVKRKFAEWKKALRSFLGMLSFKQLLTIALALADTTAPSLRPAFLAMKNRPEERKQLEQFVLTQAVDPAPPMLAALAISGAALLMTPGGFEFMQPLRSYALSLGLPDLERVRTLFESALSRGDISGTLSGLSEGDLKRELQESHQRREQKQNTQYQARQYDLSERREQSQDRQQPAQPDNAAQPETAARPPRMKNVLGLSKSARRELKRAAAEEKDRARDKPEQPARDEHIPLHTGKESDKAQSEAHRTAQQMGLREFLRDRAVGNIPGNTAAPRTAQNPGGTEQPPEQPRPRSSGRSFTSAIAKPKDEKAVPTAAPASPAAKENPAPIKESRAEPASQPSLQPPQSDMQATALTPKPPKSPPPQKPAGLPDGISADLLKAFSGMASQDASTADLGQKKSSLPRDDKLALQTKPTPQIER